MVYKILHRRGVTYFRRAELQELLIKSFKMMGESGNYSLLDLGCNEGNVLLTAKEKGLITDATHIVGVDLSENLVNRFKTNIPEAHAIIADACHVDTLTSNTFDLIICSGIIEHVPDDNALLMEIKRLLKPGGVVFLLTSIRHKHSFWIYKRKGKFTLDPEHVREYKDADEILSLMKKNGFNINDTLTRPLKFYSLSTIFLYFLYQIGLIKSNNVVYENFTWFKILSHIKIPLKPFGFEIIEIIATS